MGTNHELQREREAIVACQHNLVSDIRCAVGGVYRSRLERENVELLKRLDEIDKRLNKPA